MIWSTSQHALHDCTLQLEDSVLEQAGLFPFFDNTGHTKALMLVSPATSQILLADYEPDLFSRRFPWQKKLALRRTDYRDSTAEEAEEIAELWHFDPWWKLGAERYAGHAAVPILWETNLPGQDETITKLWFASDLSRVTWIGTGSGEDFREKRFQPKALDQASKQRGHGHRRSRSSRVQTGWVLRSFM